MLRYSKKARIIILISLFSFLVGCSAVPVSNLSDNQLMAEYRKLKSIVSGPIPYIPTRPGVPVEGGVGSWAAFEAADITKKYTIDSSRERLNEVREEMMWRGMTPW